MITIIVDTRKAVVTGKELITTGSAGIEIQLSFSSDWEGLDKFVIIRNGDDYDSKTIAMLGDTGITELPVENCASEYVDEPIFVGVYGENEEGTIVIPTIWASIGPLREGATYDDSIVPEDAETMREYIRALADDACGEYSEQAAASATASAESASASAASASIANAAKTAAQAAQAEAETAAARDTAAWLNEHITNPDSPPLDRTLMSSSAAAPADMVGDLKSALDDLNNKYFYREFSFPGDSYHFEVTDIYVNANETIIVETTATSVGMVSTTGGASSLDVGAVGSHKYTPDAAGYIRFYCRNFYGCVYYPSFNIVSEEGTSKFKAASQYLAKQVADSVAALSDDVDDLSDALDNKYDRYKVETIQGLSLSDFSICPTQYTIVQYDNTDALQHGTITGYISSKFSNSIKDVKFKIYQIPLVNLAVTNNKAIAFAINATSGNVGLYQGSSYTSLSGIFRNENCRQVVVGDAIHAVQDGTKIALYLIENNADIPIFADEFVDIYKEYAESAEISASDVGIGFTTENTYRNEPVVYDVEKIVAIGDHFMPYDDVDARLSALENGAGFNPYKVDLFMFMGQSNIAGRGTGSQAPDVIADAGYEFRAISDPTKLYPIVEPFGVNENNNDGINDAYGSTLMKSGDMIPAFVNAYFEHTHVSIVGVSASEGGTRISLWQPSTARYLDAKSRFDDAVEFLEENDYTIRHKYMLWCQGESDGDADMSKSDYKAAFTTMANAWFANGIEKIFVVKIGNYNGSSGYDYNIIMTAQNELCQELPNVVMASTDFAGMKARDLMKDDFHYKQAAYNEVGEYSGINVALYVNTEKEPTMYDTQNGTLYFSHKN